MSDKKHEQGGNTNLKKPDNQVDSQIADSVEADELRKSTRRKVLKTGGFVAGAGVVLDQWTKPVIDVVSLPAHAGVSPGTRPLIGQFIITGNADAFTPQGSSEYAASQGGHNPSPIDFLIPAAYAAFTPSPGPTPMSTPSPTPMSTPSPTPMSTPSPTPMSTPSPTPMATVSPTPAPTQAPTPAPTSGPSPVPSPSPAPAGCGWVNQCLTVVPRANDLSVSVSNIGSTLASYTGTLTYVGNLAGVAFAGFFPDQSRTSTSGTLSGLCIGTYNATQGGNCTPGAVVVV